MYHLGMYSQIIENVFPRLIMLAQIPQELTEMLPEMWNACFTEVYLSQSDQNGVTLKFRCV